MKIISNSVTKILCKIQKITYGKNFNCYGIPVIAKNKNAKITIGSDCRIRSSLLSNLIGLYQRTIIVAKGKGNIEIGNDVGMSGITIYARESIKIGEKCLIGANTKIIDNDFHPTDYRERLTGDRRNAKSASVIIGNNVFIGMNCIILKGTKIGDNCTIGAGSVVSGEFEGNCVIAGNPAKVIKKLV